jgi:hypothetical protein
MEFDFTNLIECLITFLSALATAFIIPFFKQKLSDEKQQKLQFWVQVAVTAAEQLFGSKAGQQKKDYVVAFLLSKGIVVDVDEVTALIESEVYKLTLDKEKTQ